MNVIRKKIDSLLNKEIEVDKIKTYFYSTFFVIFLLSTGFLINGLWDSYSSKFSTREVQGIVVESSKEENKGILSALGIKDKITYNTIIKIDNKIIESNSKEVYYLCKDSVNGILNFKVKVLDEDLQKILEVKD